MPNFKAVTRILEGNFLDYIEEYDVYDDSEDKVKDEDVLDSYD